MHLNLGSAFLAMSTIGLTSLAAADSFINGTSAPKSSVNNCVKACGSDLVCQSACTGIVHPTPSQISAASQCIRGCDGSDITCKTNCIRNSRNSTMDIEKLYQQLTPNAGEIVRQICQNWTALIPQAFGFHDWSDADIDEMFHICEEGYYDVFDHWAVCSRDSHHCYDIISGEQVRQKHLAKGGAVHVQISYMFLWGLTAVVGVWVL